MKLCTGGQVDIDALARTLAMEERTIAWAEGNNRPAPPINEKWWVEYRQHYWEMAHSHLNALKEIY